MLQIQEHIGLYQQDLPFFATDAMVLSKDFTK